MMRRISDPPVYEHLKQLQPLNQISTVGAIGLGFTTFLFLWNVISQSAQRTEGASKSLAFQYPRMDSAVASRTWKLSR